MRESYKKSNKRTYPHDLKMKGKNGRTNDEASDADRKKMKRKHLNSGGNDFENDSESKTKAGSKEKGKVKERHLKMKAAAKDPWIEAEDREIARLGKLLGINTGKGKANAASKLNKEFELFEGIGGNFGDFLMDLDDLEESINDPKKKSKIAQKYGNEDDDEYDYNDVTGHLLDDDELEASDLEDEVDEEDDEEQEEEEDDDVEGEGVDEGEEEEGDDEEGDEEDEEEEGSEGSESNEDEDSDGDDGDDSTPENDTNDDKHIYRPVKGEDIYGRTIGSASSSETSSKYIPPARRQSLLTTVDESSESVKLLRRSMNGLMNKLSDQTKDTIVREIKKIFDKNSLSVTNVILKDCIMAACANSTQVMTNIIPIYASIIGALHYAVGMDVGAYLVENLCVSLHKAIDEAKKDPRGQHLLIGNKLPSNALLLLVCLYNYRILHHTLIVDIMYALAGVNIDSTKTPTPTPTPTPASSSSSSSSMEMIGELEIELIVCIIDHCGLQLRSDDPAGLKTVIMTLSQRAAHRDNKGSSRVSFMLEALTDLRNNKSRRNQTANAEAVKKVRKWLGSIKSTMSSKSGDSLIRVSLSDLLDAEKRGRWWRAGASWVGNQSGGNGVADEEGGNGRSKSEGEGKQVGGLSGSGKKVSKSEEEKLLKLATKMHFNTSIRKSIFVVLMSSRDVADACERLCRLEFKGKQDREIIRVVVECCGQEKTYNAFYSEVVSVLCSQNRQFKTTTQYTFWDFFKLLCDDDDRVTERKVLNLARMLAHLVYSFHVPLAVIKPIDMADLSSKHILFLATFFIALFSAKISDETYTTIFDRVATTKDFSTVRESVLYFLQRHLVSIPPGLDANEKKSMEQRRKIAIRTMEAMSVLEISAGQMEDGEDEENGDEF